MNKKQREFIKFYKRTWKLYFDEDCDFRVAKKFYKLFMNEVNKKKERNKRFNKVREEYLKNDHSNKSELQMIEEIKMLEEKYL